MKISTDSHRTLYKTINLICQSTHNFRSSEIRKFSLGDFEINSLFCRLDHGFYKQISESGILIEPPVSTDDMLTGVTLL